MIAVQTLIELEKRGWEALASDGDAARDFYRSRLADEAVMVFPGGRIVEGKAEILDSMDAQPWDSFEIEEPRVIAPAEDTGVVVYRVTAKRPGQDEYAALISSVYTRREGDWKLVLHQQTPV